MEYRNPSSWHLRVKVNNGNTRKMCAISSKLKIKTPEQCLRRSGVFMANCEQIAHNILVFSLFTLNK